MTATPPKLDHVAINVLYQVDRAEEAFRNLGFRLTERGYHTLGSINHLMIFGTDYLELVGLPVGSQSSRPGRLEIATAPLGLNGLVFKTSDVDETYAHLQDIGMAGDAPISFSRPVELPDGTVDACFRTVQVHGDVFSGGRVYFCEHSTPELVWRPEWQKHRNGALAIPRIVIASERHARVADDFAELLFSDVVGSGDCFSVQLDAAHISFLSPNAYQERYRDLASAMSSRISIFGALIIRVADLSVLRGIVDDVGLPAIDTPESLIIRDPAFDTVLEFVC
jgi:glyoxalase-like protein